ncbi:MAG: nucleotidyltransferase family protein [Gammaproteobacteria bacterium]
MAEPLRAALMPLCHRITLALVYGSIAKGTATAASDIDLLVVAQELTLEDLYSALEPAEQQTPKKGQPNALYRQRVRPAAIHP